jgi:hypothetical protein
VERGGPDRNSPSATADEPYDGFCTFVGFDPMKSRKRFDMKAVKKGDAAKVNKRAGRIQRVMPGMETPERVDPAKTLQDLERLCGLAKRACSM